MNYTVVAAISLVFFVAIAAAMWLGWSRQRMRQETLYPEPTAVPEQWARGASAAALPGIPVSYVATTRGDDPFARIMAHGLGFRGNATFFAAADGIVLDREGERGFFVPAADITAAEPASTAIDRGVETDGMVAIAWRLGKLPVVTTLRPRRSADKAAIFEAISELSGSGPGHPQP